jgi:hypothetical protein
MTDEATTPPPAASASASRTSLVPAALREWPHTTIVALSLAVFLVTLVVYGLSNANLSDRLLPRDSPYVHHVNQANAMIHGRLDIDPQYAKNANLLERAIDDEWFDDIEQGITPPPCGQIKCYLTHPPMPAIMLMPLVAIWGLGVNQTIISVILGAITAVLVFHVTRSMTERVVPQLLYTVLFAFGTIFWYTAAHGGVWFFSHTAAVMFLFLALYATLGPKNALLAGIGLGAAFLSRNPTAWAVLFIVIMFSVQWLQWSTDRPLLKRIDPKPLALIAAGALPFVIFSFWFNYARFEDPFEAGYNHSEQVYQPFLQGVYGDGLFQPEYVKRHMPAVFEAMPIFKSSAPYIIPFGLAMATWATTPAFFYSFFVGIRRRWVIAGMAVALAAASLAIIGAAASEAWNLGPLDGDITGKWQFLPFYAAIVIAIVSSVRLLRHGDRLALACWAAIVPIALTNFFFAATGWTQFGYRYGLDFYPFLFLLTIKAMGPNPRWHAYLFVLLSVVVNLWAVLWIYQFGPAGTNGWQWFEFF